MRARLFAVFKSGCIAPRLALRKTVGARDAPRRYPWRQPTCKERKAEDHLHPRLILRKIDLLQALRCGIWESLYHDAQVCPVPGRISQIKPIHQMNEVISNFSLKLCMLPQFGQVGLPKDGVILPYFLAANDQADKFRHPLGVKNHEAGKLVPFL